MVTTEPSGLVDPRSLAAGVEQLKSPKAVLDPIKEGAFWVQDIYKPDMRFKTGRRLVGTQYPEGQIPEGKKNPTEDELKGCIFSPRLHFTDAQIERARNVEIPSELIAQEIPAVSESILKKHFAKWLTESGNLATLTDDDVLSLHYAIDKLIEKARLKNFFRPLPQVTADAIRQNSQQQLAVARSMNFTNPVSAIHPVENDLNLSMLFKEDGQFSPDYGNNTTGIHSIVDCYAASTEPGWNVNPYEAIADNVDELTYLTHRLTSLLSSRDLNRPLQDFSTVLHFLSKHGTAKSYNAYHYEGQQKQEKPIPADIGDLLQRFAKAKLHVGVSALFKLATGKDTPIGNFGEVAGIPQLIEEKWGSTLADLDEKSRHRFDEKYDWYFNRMKKLLDTPEDKVLEVYTDIDKEHQRRFSFPPPASTPIPPSNPWYGVR